MQDVGVNQTRPGKMWPGKRERLGWLRASIGEQCCVRVGPIMREERTAAASGEISITAKTSQAAPMMTTHKTCEGKEV